MTNKCPACESTRIYPSRVRSIVERLRRAMTEKEPYRCHKCNHRGWYPIDVPGPTGPDKSPEELRLSRATAPVTAEDLDRLDNR